jgi:glyoxylase-like metal-dependent hydrolase (beta-lactamase superfamily II)
MASFSVGSIQVEVVQDGMLRMPPSRLWDEPLETWRHGASLDESGELVQLSVHCLVVRSGGQIAVLDTGLGLSENSTSTPSVHGTRGQLPDELRRLGIAPEQVDAVVLSHGHGDHIGGNVSEGRPSFPRARYFMGAADFFHFTSDEFLMGSPFHAEQLLPLQEREQLELTDGEHEVLPGVRILPAPGHTPGHICVGLTSNGEHGLYLGDLVHQPIQIEQTEWSPTFDLMPQMSARSRRAVLDRARAERALVLTAHFPFPGVGRIAAGWAPGA